MIRRCVYAPRTSFGAMLALKYEYVQEVNKNEEDVRVPVRVQVT